MIEACLDNAPLLQMCEPHPTDDLAASIHEQHTSTKAHRSAAQSFRA